MICGGDDAFLGFDCFWGGGSGGEDAHCGGRMRNVFLREEKPEAILRK